MNTPTLYVTILLLLGLAGAAAICYRLLRRGLQEDYLSIATLAVLVVFVVVGVGGPLLYAYTREIPLIELSGMAFLCAFGGMAAAVALGAVIARHRKGMAQDAGETTGREARG
jgi:hypothetical protein